MVTITIITIAIKNHNHHLINHHSLHQQHSSFSFYFLLLFPHSRHLFIPCDHCKRDLLNFTKKCVLRIGPLVDSERLYAKCTLIQWTQQSKVHRYPEYTVSCRKESEAKTSQQPLLYKTPQPSTAGWFPPSTQMVDVCWKEIQGMAAILSTFKSKSRATFSWAEPRLSCVHSVQSPPSGLQSFCTQIWTHRCFDH